MSKTTDQGDNVPGPDLYIEVTRTGFKMRPSDVSKEEYLSDKWHTDMVYRITPFPSGTYLLYNLHKNPHYQLPQSMRSTFDRKAQEKNVTVTTITNDV